MGKTSGMSKKEVLVGNVSNAGMSFSPVKYSATSATLYPAAKVVDPQEPVAGYCVSGCGCFNDPEVVAAYWKWRADSGYFMSPAHPDRELYVFQGGGKYGSKAQNIEAEEMSKELFQLDTMLEAILFAHYGPNAERIITDDGCIYDLSYTHAEQLRDWYAERLALKRQERMNKGDE